MKKKLLLVFLFCFIYYFINMSAKDVDWKTFLNGERLGMCGINKKFSNLLLNITFFSP